MHPSIKITLAGSSVFSPPLALLLISQVYKAFFPVTLILISMEKNLDIDLVGERTEVSKRLIAWNDRALSIFSSLSGIMCLFLANGKVDYE